jgi:hypothetical protein
MKAAADESYILGGKHEDISKDEQQQQQQQQTDQDYANLFDRKASPSPTESTGSFSEEEGGGGWLGGFTADFRSLACTLKNTAAEVAVFVHTNAMAVAQEIGELERDERTRELANASRQLPWDIQDDQGEWREDDELKEQILLLSKSDCHFLEPFSSGGSTFALDEPRVQLIRALLEIDSNLAATHARLSTSEARFWKNYFHHCDQAREEHIERHGMVAEALSLSLMSGDSLILDSGASDSIKDDDEEDDSSYVRIPTAPNSMNSMFGLASMDDCVLVQQSGKLAR